MTSRMSQLTVFALVAVAALAVASLVPAKAADKSASKEEIEKIVHDYIMNNAQVILDSVDAHQKKTMQVRQEEGLKKNLDAIQKDAGSPVAGNPAGDVTVVEFFDYNCGYCKVTFDAVQKLIEKDKNIRFVFKEFPILGPTSETASQWALAAHKQNKYLEFHTALMKNKTPINEELLEKIAKEVGLDAAQAKKDASLPEIMDQIDKNRTLANDLGLSGTPAFVIGEEVVPGAIPVEAMEEKIKQIRASKK